jgi:hypothetical protein
MTEPADEQDLPDAALVVRGGQMSVRRVQRKARAARPALDGVAGISVAAATASDMTLVALIRAGGIPHDEIQKSTVGRLRAAGFRLFRTGRWPHCTIDLGQEPIKDAASRLIRAFDAPEANPEKEKK